MTKDIFVPILSFVIFFFGCTSKVAPYKNGPVMSQKKIESTFQPILDFMGYKPGMAFADVGAGSGALTVMMASLMDNSKVFIQDIDTTVLKDAEVEKIIGIIQSKAEPNLEHETISTLRSEQSTRLTFPIQHLI